MSIIWMDNSAFRGRGLYSGCESASERERMMIDGRVAKKIADDDKDDRFHN